MAQMKEQIQTPETELNNRTLYDDGNVLISTVSSKVAPNHLWLLSSGTGANAPEELNFLFSRILIGMATCD